MRDCGRGNLGEGSGSARDCVSVVVASTVIGRAGFRTRAELESMMAVVDVRQWDAVVWRTAGGYSDDGAARATGCISVWGRILA